MSATLVFDIETVPDTGGLRALHGLDPDLSDAQVAEIAYQRRRCSHGHDFLPLHLHRVVAIACALKNGDGVFKVWCLGGVDDGEAALIQRFYDGLEKYRPQLVSWNGGGFDLPVLHYRALIHGVCAPHYWECGEREREFRYNNYISRYHTRHTDLMDLLSLYQGRAAVPLDEIARLLGCPGKLGMDGRQVWRAYLDGELAAIRNYCETDVVNTYLVFLRFQMMRGALDAEGHREECRRVRASLEAQQAAHWRDFLAAWPEPA